MDTRVICWTTHRFRARETYACIVMFWSNVLVQSYEGKWYTCAIRVRYSRGEQVNRLNFVEFACWMVVVVFFALVFVLFCDHCSWRRSCHQWDRRWFSCCVPASSKRSFIFFKLYVFCFREIQVYDVFLSNRQQSVNKCCCCSILAFEDTNASRSWAFLAKE